ncbi:class I SAM-dependent methyltransferase [Candidatus Parcubacteria bacterium]|nr:MAG: class I SAM-dependent methyltransferase [Candidatus Parcubacteria bacterium]
MGLMMTSIHWKGENEFEIDGVNFVIDVTPGCDRRRSEINSFTLVKTKSYIEDYLALQGERFDHILELGIFQGGSLVFFDKLLKPSRIVGLDIARDPVKALDHYIASEAPHMKTYYQSSQDDSALLKSIVENDLDGQLDLVVDDASHLYELTKASFMHLFPLLKPGGLYLIEDWAWAHRPNAQNRKHPWFKKPALTNLLFELVVELGSHSGIEEITVNNNMVKIRKSTHATGTSVLDSFLLRDRKLNLI